MRIFSWLLIYGIIVFTSVESKTDETDANYLEVQSLQNNWGLYYEGIGEMLLSKSDWNLVIHSDFEPVCLQRIKINDIFKVILNQCEDPNVVNLDLAECKIFSTEMNLELINVNNYFDTLMKMLGFDINKSKKLGNRLKRGLINGIGSISKQLFGTLDESDAEKYNSILQNIQSNQKDTAKLVNKQVSVIKNMFNELNNTLQHTENMENRIQLVENKFINLKKEIFNNEYLQQTKIILIENFDQFTYLVNQFKFLLTHLFDILEAARIGHIHPYVISPKELLDEMRNIQTTFDSTSSWPLPLISGNINKIISVMNIDIYTTDTQIVYILKIPVITGKAFSIYKITPIPIQTQPNVFYMLIPSKELLIVGNDKHFFVQMNRADLQECVVLDKQTYICSKIRMLHVAYSKHSCEYELLTPAEKIPNSCSPRVMLLNNTLFLELSAPNSWIFVAPKTHRIQIICKRFSKYLNIENTGIINIQPGCEIRTGIQVLTTHVSYTRNISMSFQSELTSTTDIHLFGSKISKIHLKPSDNIQKTSVIKVSDQINHLKYISQSVEELKELDLDFNEKRKNVILNWSYGSIITLFLISLFIYLVYNIFSRKLYKCTENTTTTSTPVSNPSEPFPIPNTFNQRKPTPRPKIRNLTQSDNKN